MDLSHVPDKTIAEAWVMMKEASDEREIGEFKEASFTITCTNVLLIKPPGRSDSLEGHA